MGKAIAAACVPDGNGANGASDAVCHAQNVGCRPASLITDNELHDIACEWGTPSFVFDLDAFCTRLRACQEIVGDSVSLCFAMKANPFLIAAAASRVDRLEVCSPGELMLCEQAGINPAQIVYSGVNKEISDITEALRYGAGVFTAESLLHASYLNQVACERGVVIDVLPRLNAGSQFGMSKDDLLWLVDHRKEYPGLNLVGIHYFVYTQRKKLKHQARELDMLASFLDELESDHGFLAQRLEYGPGLGVPYFTDDDFSDDLTPLRELAPALQEIAKRVELTVEMGRFFAASCGTYLTRVMDQKENKGTHYAILDGGMHHLAYYGQMMGLHTPLISNVSQASRVDAPAEECTPANEPTSEYDYCGAHDYSKVLAWYLCGSLCTVNDVLAREACLPGLRCGDVLAFRHAGAYSVTEGVHLFLSRTMPRIVLRERRGETLLARDFIESSQFNGVNAFGKE